MRKTKGEVLIAIGSVLTIIGAAFGILLGILFAFALGLGGVWFWSAMADAGIEFSELPGFSGLLVTIGAGVGIIIVAMSILVLILGVMSFKRRRDLRRSTFPFVFSLVLLVFGILQLISNFTVPGIISLVVPLLILIGAILNKMQLKGMSEQEIHAMYSGGQPYPPYGQQQYPYSGQQYQQTPYQPQQQYGRQQQYPQQPQHQYPQQQQYPQQPQQQYQPQPQYQPQAQNEQPQQARQQQIMPDEEQQKISLEEDQQV